MKILLLSLLMSCGVIKSNIEETIVISNAQDVVIDVVVTGEDEQQEQEDAAKAQIIEVKQEQKRKCGCKGKPCRPVINLE